MLVKNVVVCFENSPEPVFGQLPRAPDQRLIRTEPISVTVIKMLLQLVGLICTTAKFVGMVIRTEGIFVKVMNRTDGIRKYICQGNESYGEICL